MLTPFVKWSQHGYGRPVGYGAIERKPGREAIGAAYGRRGYTEGRMRQRGSYAQIVGSLKRAELPRWPGRGGADTSGSRKAIGAESGEVAAMDGHKVGPQRSK
jgi:hypothetical protein